MAEIKFQIVQSGDEKTIKLLAGWYLTEWKIPEEKAIQRLRTITEDKSQVQILMTLDGNPVTTGGLYHEVGLTYKIPEFRIYKNWLAQVYTIPKMRHRGFGALICNYIDSYAKELGVKEMHLFTDTAESLYTRLGWSAEERLQYGERNIVVMKKELSSNGLFDNAE